MKLSILIVLIIASLTNGALFSWMFKGYEDKEGQDHGKQTNPIQESTPEETVPDDNALTAQVPFEIKASDEKFLAEASTYTSLQLSELDFCHHRVILGLKTSCGDMTEEELARVSVNLFNCQSKAEGRPIYPCTDFMTIQECTESMDPNTWTAYHIVSNRARAVCYATRQQQFTAKTEMAVNKLMVSAEHQIHTIKNLQDGQEALGQATSNTMKTLSDGHVQLQVQQKMLSSSNSAIHNYVATNLRELSREKSLIASGQKELVMMTQSIKSKLDEFREQLSHQEDGQKEVHESILLDLANIQDNALKVWQKLDGSTQRILATHEETVRQYSHLTQDIQRMNGTVHQAIKLIEKVEDNMSWIYELLGDTETTVQKVYICISHGGFIFIAMVSGSFLQMPGVSRILMLLLIPLNAMTEMQHQYSLQLSTLASVLVAIVMCELLFKKLYSQWKKDNGHLNMSLNHSCMYDINTSAYDINCSFPNDKKTKVMPSIIQQNISNTNSEYSSDDDQEVPKKIPLNSGELFGLTKRNINSNNNAGFVGHKNAETNSDNQADVTKHPFLDYSSRAETKTVAEVRRHLFNDSYELSKNSSVNKSNTSLNRPRSRSNTPKRMSKSINLSQTLTPKKQCSGICKNGQPCRMQAGQNSDYCHKHIGGSREGTPA